MENALLQLEHLSVSFRTPAGEVEAVRDVSLSLAPGEILAVVGESGCGKSALCKAIMKLLPANASARAEKLTVAGHDIASLSERQMRPLRGALFSMVFQDPMTSLDPTYTVGAQIAEAVRAHEPRLKKPEVHRRVLELMDLVGIDRPEERCRLYPWNFSGGMRQRAVLAIALAGRPKLLIADEPTTALDVTVQAQILDLLRSVQRRLGAAAILVTHDLGVVARAADRVAVMYAGKIVETGTAEEVFYDPRHPYTWGLLRSLPSLAAEGESLYAIPGMPPTLIAPPKGDAFASRNEYALAIDYERQPPLFPAGGTHFAATWLLDSRAPHIAPPRPGAAGVLPAQARPAPGEVLLDVRHLCHSFHPAKNVAVRALEDVSFTVRRGEIFGLVGESGSGKSTLARCVMGVLRPQSGSILYKGVDVCDPAAARAARHMLRTDRQIVFQDSASSLDPRMKAADIIAEPMAVNHIAPPRGSLREEAAFQMRYVGLDPLYLDKYPPELSGGQRQRVAIARALAMEPSLLVADEPVAALDVSIQAQILNLFRHLQAEHGFTFLFIAHDLSVVRYLCDRVGVLYRGRLVELAPTKELFARPIHPYTKSLLSAIPLPDPRKERDRPLCSFDGAAPGPGGRFTETAPGHFVLTDDGKEAAL